MCINIAASQVAVGWSHCLALTAKGVVYSWGRGDLGQLGACDAAIIKGILVVTVSSAIAAVAAHTIPPVHVFLL